MKTLNVNFNKPILHWILLLIIWIIFVEAASSQNINNNDVIIDGEVHARIVQDLKNYRQLQRTCNDVNQQLVNAQQEMDSLNRLVSQLNTSLAINREIQIQLANQYDDLQSDYSKLQKIYAADVDRLIKLREKDAARLQDYRIILRRAEGRANRFQRERNQARAVAGIKLGAVTLVMTGFTIITLLGALLIQNANDNASNSSQLVPTY